MSIGNKWLSSQCIENSLNNTLIKCAVRKINEERGMLFNQEPLIVKCSALVECLTEQTHFSFLYSFLSSLFIGIYVRNTSIFYKRFWNTIPFFSLYCLVDRSLWITVQLHLRASFRYVSTLKKISLKGLCSAYYKKSANVFRQYSRTNYHSNLQYDQKSESYIFVGAWRYIWMLWSSK